jgi:alkanesulfonate monooxygenase SsuD/methylene tetrahydromethanopterin reductase-like flavin-dependent oxidoreductase (luciferase family)
MSGRLGFGYLYDFRNPPQWHRPWDRLYGEILDAVAWSESAGFSHAWVPEHHMAGDGYMPSPLVAMSARTRTLRIGTGIALAPLYHPVRFATDCAVLDAIAGGRIDIGLAIGYRRRETAAFGVDFSTRGRIFDEWLEIVSRLFAGETLDFAGQHFQFSGARLMPPIPRGRMPLYIGGFADKSVERVIRYGDGYLGSEEVCRAYVDKLRQSGRDPASARVRITGIMTVVADDPEAALDELAPYYHHVNNSYGEWFFEDKVHSAEHGFRPMTLDEFKASGTLQVMTPDEAIAMFRRLQASLPLDHYMFAMPPGLPADRFVHYAGTVADKVVPAFAQGRRSPGERS